ncbi:MAG: PPOX class F420-dependent oxidoreductase [Nitrososphaerales archaeon]|nr:PPOX class F420-dependent oxidoreductase [Nitrososphaerales archaeon]
MTSIEQFSGRRYINLESYKKNGEPKLTPVQSLEHDGLIYMRTDPTTWKVKRIRRNSHVRVVPSSMNGKPIGTWVEGEARMLEGEERDQMLNVFRKEYGGIGFSMMGFVGRLRGERMTAIISIKL